MLRYILLVAIVQFSLFSISAFSQSSRLGIPRITTHNRNTAFKELNQTWSICQDTSDVMYFGTSSGLLLFNGYKWAKIEVKDQWVIRSVCAAKDGKVYAGAYQEFGYLGKNSCGYPTYISLLNKIPEGNKDFGEVFNIQSVGDFVIFQSSLYTFIFKEQNLIKIIKANTLYISSATVNSKYYVYEANSGVYELNDLKFTLLPQSQNIKDIVAILPFELNGLLFVTSTKGVYHYSKSSISLFNTKSNSIFQTNTISKAIAIPNDMYAFGTITNGVYLTNKEFEPILWLSNKNGLSESGIICCFIDNHKNLWLGNEAGVDLIEINSPFSYISKNQGVGGGVFDFMTFKNKLFVGTTKGLFYSSLGLGSGDSDFKIIKKSEGQVWSLKQVGGNAVCGHNNGTFQINGLELTKISDLMGGWNFIPLKSQKNWFLQGSYCCLSVFENGAQNVKFLNVLDGLNISARTIEQDASGSIWLTHPADGIFKFNIGTDFRKITDLKHYDFKKGCPKNVYVRNWFDEVIFTSNTGIYKYDKSSDSIVPHIELNHLFGTSDQLSEIKPDTKGNTFFVKGDMFGEVVKSTDGKYHINDTIFQKISNNFIKGFERIYIHDSTQIFIGTRDGFVVFHTDYCGDFAKYRCKALVNEVKLTGQKDTLLLEMLTPNSEELNLGEISYSNNAIQFSFNSLDTEDDKLAQFTYHLYGYDDKFSSWSQKRSVNYVNLQEGNYTFKVKARNLFKTESKEVLVYFKILPPWYRSVYAYILYLFLIMGTIGVIYLLIKRELRIQHEKWIAQKDKELKETMMQLEKDKLISEKELIELKNITLKDEMERKNSELASFAIQINLKNEALQDVSRDLIAIIDSNKEPIREIRRLLSDIERNTNQDDEWERFSIYFDQVHTGFLGKIKTQFPDLNITDLKLCAYLRMNMNTKDIVALTNNSVRGIEKARYRLRKKLNLDTDTNLNEFLLIIG